MPHYIYVLVAYFIGSIPIGVSLAVMKGKDPRKVGSGNIGATNVIRAAGKTLGIVTLLGDILKGFFPTFIAMQENEPLMTIALVGFATFVGHLFSVFLRFRGGKGVATALGVYVAIAPLVIAICMAVFVVVVIKWRYVSLGSITGAGVVPIVMYVLNTPVEYIWLAIAAAILVIIKHNDNIRRLIKGQENKISFRK